MVVTDFESLVFGGLVPDAYGQLTTTNDLLLIKTRAVTGRLKGNEVDSEMALTTLEGLDVASYRVVKPADARYPLARRDHSVTLIKKNTQMLVFGGRNDSSA